MRRVGVEARPDLVQIASQGGGSDSGPSEKKDERDGDDTHKDDNEHTESSPSESQVSPAPESSESHSIDNQLLNNAKACYLGNHGETMVLVIINKILLQYVQMICVSLMLSMMDASDSTHLLSLIPDR